MRGLAPVPRMHDRSSIRMYLYLLQPARATDYTSTVLYSRLDVRLQNVIIPDARDLLSILNIDLRYSLSSPLLYTLGTRLAPAVLLDHLTDPQKVLAVP